MLSLFNFIDTSSKLLRYIFFSLKSPQIILPIRFSIFPFKFIFIKSKISSICLTRSYLSRPRCVLIIFKYPSSFIFTFICANPLCSFFFFFYHMILFYYFIFCKYTNSKFFIHNIFSKNTIHS